MVFGRFVGGLERANISRTTKLKFGKGSIGVTENKITTNLNSIMVTEPFNSSEQYRLRHCACGDELMKNSRWSRVDDLTSSLRWVTNEHRNHLILEEITIR